MAVETQEQQQPAPAPLQEEEEELSDEEQGAGAGSEADSSPSEGEEGADGKQKRKKKKKKKKGGGGGGGAAAASAGGGGASQPPVDPAAKKEGERRFQEAVDQLSHNSEDSMWVKLGGCHLADGKMKRLCEALRANTTVISIDLSANCLTDEGAKLLAAALLDGRAPDLIDLDLQDNPLIQEAGSTALEELQLQRKTLRVVLGPSPQQQQQEAEAAAQQQQEAQRQSGQQQGQGPGGASAQQQQQQHANGSGEGGGGAAGASLADTVKNNPVISKYFAVGNDEADDAEEGAQQGQGGGGGGAGGPEGSQQGGQGGEEEQLGGLTAAELAQILWDQLEQCLDAPKPDIPAVSEPLRAIAEQVEHEMDNSTLPLPAEAEMTDLKTFTQWALRKLHVLHSVLDLVPPPLLTPYSKDKPVSTVGTHRAAVSELLAQLLRAECPLVAHMVAASGVLRRCAVIAVEHPNCSAIHGSVARCLRAALSKPVGQVGLWQQLLGSAPVAAPRGAVDYDRGGSLNLATEAALIAAAAKAAPTVGKRPANVGFALAVGQLLHAAATGEQLGHVAGKEGEGEGQGEGQQQQQAPAAGDAGGGQGAASSSGQQQEQAEQPAAGSGGSADAPQQQQEGGTQAGQAGGEGQKEEEPAVAGGLLLAEKPQWKSGLPRVPSESAMPLSASGAVAELPEEGESWVHQLQLALATTEPWADFSSGPDCSLRKLLAEQEGDLGGPRPRPSQEPEPDSDDGDVSPGQIISGQELLMMLRGLNLGGFSGGM